MFEVLTVSSRFSIVMQSTSHRQFLRKATIRLRSTWSTFSLISSLLISKIFVFGGASPPFPPLSSNGGDDNEEDDEEDDDEEDEDDIGEWVLAALEELAKNGVGGREAEVCLAVLEALPS